MKYIFVLLLLSITIISTAQIPAGVSSKTVLYFVRHAEKQGGSDPALTVNGNIRAGDLMRYLQNKKVKHIYATQYKRTQMTGDSMRLQLGIDTVLYKAEESGADLFNKMAANGDFKKVILVIGHSNTVPDYIKKAGVANYPVTDIADNEFDNIYKVYYRRPFLFGRFKAKVRHYKYGMPSASSATMQ
jgi:Histidine phosphatase superfamily (branch 1)